MVLTGGRRALNLSGVSHLMDSWAACPLPSGGREKRGCQRTALTGSCDSLCVSPPVYLCITHCPDLDGPGESPLIRSRRASRVWSQVSTWMGNLHGSQGSSAEAGNRKLPLFISRQSSSPGLPGAGSEENLPGPFSLCHPKWAQGTCGGGGSRNRPLCLPFLLPSFFPPSLAPLCGWITRTAECKAVNSQRARAECHSFGSCLFQIVFLP